MISYSVSGASTIAATNNKKIKYESGSATDIAEFGGLDLATVTAGSNTFTLEGRVSAGTGTVTLPEIAVIAF